MKSILIVSALSVMLLGSFCRAQDQSHLQCNIGPLTKTFGQTSWLVYSCDDSKSLVVITAPGNPAAPFYFFVSPEGSGYHVRGEGIGSKAASDAANDELQSTPASAIRELLNQTKQAKSH